MIDNTSIGGWFAKEYKNYVDVLDARCVFYCRLYKKSTPDAVAKAREMAAVMNSIIPLQIKVDDAEAEVAMYKINDNTIRNKLDEVEKELAGAKSGGRSVYMEVTALKNIVADLSTTVRNLSESLSKKERG